MSEGGREGGREGVDDFEPSENQSIDVVYELNEQNKSFACCQLENTHLTTNHYDNFLSFHRSSSNTLREGTPSRTVMQWISFV